MEDRVSKSIQKSREGDGINNTKNVWKKPLGSYVLCLLKNIYYIL